jgi:hypothetical protein
LKRLFALFDNVLDIPITPVRAKKDIILVEKRTVISESAKYRMLRAAYTNKQGNRMVGIMPCRTEMVVYRTPLQNGKHVSVTKHEVFEVKMD